MAKKVFHQIPGFPGWEIVVVLGRRSKKHPTGYAILKQNGRNDCMIVNLMGDGKIIYVAMIIIEYVQSILDTYLALRVLNKTKQGYFTIIGRLKNGDNRTLAMSLIHEFSKKPADPNWVPHHPDGDPTNDLYVIPIDDFIHGQFHKSIQPGATQEEIERVARQLGNKEFIRYYSSHKSRGKYSHKTYKMCEKMHEKDFFGWMDQDSYYALIDAVRNEFFK